MKYRPASIYSDILPDLRKIAMAILREDDQYADEFMTDIKRRVHEVAAGLNEHRKQVEADRKAEDGLI